MIMDFCGVEIVKVGIFRCVSTASRQDALTSLEVLEHAGDVF